MRLAISRIDGRSPNASGQMSTAGCAPVVGWMKAASHMPSGVVTVTFVSTTGTAAAAEPAASPSPAASDNVTKSLRETSADDGVFGSCSSCIVRLSFMRRVARLESSVVGQVEPVE